MLILKMPEKNDLESRQSNEPDQWDTVIQPHGSLFTLNAYEVWKHRDLLYLLTRRDIVAFYKQTVLGPVWFFIQPVFTSLIYVLVFGQIAGLGTDGIPQIIFYLCGVTLWNYFAECFNKTATVFKDNAQLFGKVYFPRVISPLSIVASNLVRFFIQFSLFLLVLCFYVAHGEVKPTLVAILLPITVLVMAVMGLSFGMLFSALTTKYRDLVFLLQFGVQLLMYATPVIYPASLMPPNVAKVLAWNPLSPLFEVTRLGFLGQGSVTASAYGYSVFFAVVTFLISTAVFNRVERTFMDTV